MRDQTNLKHRSITIEEDLIVVGLHAPDSETVIRVLGELLHRHGHVRESFVEAVLERERTFPTGLPARVPVAIPHVDPAYCNSPAVAVGILDTPVPFRAMGASEQIVPVQAVFLFAVTEFEPRAQWLSRLAELFKQPALMRRILSAESASQVANILRDHLLSNEERKQAEGGVR